MSEAANPDDALEPSGDPRRLVLPDGLVLVPTPIGNLGDLSPRAVATLKGADVILCEDTRVTSRLCMAYGIRAALLALHEHNEDARIPAVLARLSEGERVALVSDAGMPLLSDPGFRLVRAAIAAGLPVGGLPGPNAATLALVLSGLPPTPFLFAGFLPPRGAARRTALGGIRDAEAAGLRATLIWHEAPHRLADMLADVVAVLGNRPAAVARELTKRFEEVRRGDAADLAAHYAAAEARGEITVVVAPGVGEAAPSTDDLDALLLRRREAGESLRDAVAGVSAEAGTPRKAVYARALTIWRSG